MRYLRTMKINLTNANIYDLNDISKLNFKDYIFNFQELNNFKYLLIIQSKTPECIKLTIYPINKKRITKIIISGEQIPKNDIEKLINTLKSFRILHTSGLTTKDNKLFYECYINGSLLETEDPNIAVFIESIEKLKKIIKNIRIEEISLDRRI